MLKRDEMTDVEFDVANSRRIALICKRHWSGLDADEAAELEKLQRSCFDYLGAKHPNPAMDTLRDKIEAIRRRLEG